MIININRKGILYIGNKLSKSNSNSTNDNKGKLDDSRMEYKCECDDIKCSGKWNNNIKCECNILCNHITSMYGMTLYNMMSSSMSELCSMKLFGSKNDI